MIKAIAPVKWLISMVVVLALAACGGGGGGSGGTAVVGAQNEGTLANPINLGVVSPSISRAGTVGAYGVSYYRFQTGAASGSHTISLRGTKSDLSWSLYSSSSSWLQNCDNLLTAADESCATVTLSANTVYYLQVDEWDHVAGTFTLVIEAPVTPVRPTANAGPDQSVKTGQLATLDGSASSDPNGDPITHAWSFTAKPAGSTATLSSSTAIKPTFTPDVDGTYTLSLVVSDGTNASVADSVNIVSATFNSVPVANAGANRFVVAGAAGTVTLDASASSDADGDALSYAWTLTSKPAGSTAVLTGAGSVSSSFTADLEGVYVASLVVNDGQVDSSAATVTITAYRAVHALSFRVIDAEYSKSLDKIIMVASQPTNQLHIYDPVAKTDTAVDLNLVPTSVSVSPDGMYAAVGHNAWISYVNLSTGALLKTIATTADVIDVVLAGNGYAYAFPRIDQWETIRAINLATGAETLSTGYSIYAGTRAKLHPGGTSIYGANNGLSPSDIEKYGITGGTATYLYDSPYHGDYAMCGDLWMSEDGMRIFTKCGNVFRASANRYSSGTTAEDMTYNGALQNLSSVLHLTHSSAAGLVAAVPANTWNNSAADRELQRFNYDFLTFNSKVTLPHFVASPTSAFPGRGRFVFYNSAGTAHFVVLQADSSSGMLYDYGVVSY